MTYPKIFKSDDFYSPATTPSEQEFAEQAQSIFEAWLKENGKAVYAFKTKHTGEDLNTWTIKDDDMRYTHQALLINIQEIKTKKCDHTVSFPNSSESIKYFYCKHCNKKLKANWSVAE